MRSTLNSSRNPFILQPIYKTGNENVMLSCIEKAIMFLYNFKMIALYSVCLPFAHIFEKIRAVCLISKGVLPCKIKREGIMGLFTFKGGVHPYEGKELSAAEPIAKLDPGPELVFLMSQHIGAPAKPVVAVGDRVLRGQMVGEAGGFVSAPVYSSVSGTVKSIEKRKTATGASVDAVVIENDGKFEEAVFSPVDPEKLSRDEILERIRKAGVVGMGGAGFPTAVKLAPKDPSRIDHILVNASECEPYLTSDYRCLLEETDKVACGLEIILKLFGPSCKGIICIENNKPDAVEVMKKAAAGKDRIEVAVTLTKYPEGAERNLIKAMTGREVNSSMLPADAGCVVDNVQTVIAIYDAVALGRPCFERVFTVSGDAPKKPRNFRVAVGTPYSRIIEQAGGFKETPEKIISGGPMMGFALADLDVPVTKTSGALTCFIKDPLDGVESSACIRCGRCIEACPERLVPCRLLDIALHDDMQKFQDEHGMECVGCGCCSYTCPAKRPLAVRINGMRGKVLAERRKKK